MIPAGCDRNADATARTWPFWAPSTDDAVRDALDLAALRPGEHLVDLGCGDGHVLLAAARRGATVGGVEADPELAATAAENLAEAGVTAAVVTGDLLDPAVDLAADVLFTYLAPATLQRLLPRLRHQHGTRLVTVDFEVPGLVANRSHGRAHAYRLPGRRRRIGETGWPSAGSLVAAPPEALSLTVLGLVHPAGPTRARLTGSVRDHATVLAGADHLDRAAHLAVDLRVEPAEPGTVAWGSICTAGLPPHRLVAVWTDEDEGVWELSDEGVAGVRRAVRRRTHPSTLAGLLDAATT